jgi:hypothetical protein
VNKLTVVSPTFYPSLEPCQLLVDSCKQHKLNLHLYGLGEPWTWYTDVKVFRLAEEIKKIDSEYILVCDADDAFFVTDEKEILHTYHKTAGDRILVSADRIGDGDEKYPQSIFRDKYPASATPWKYCNSGGYIGKKEAILDLLDKMATVQHPTYIPVWRSKDWANDQFRMSVVFLNGYPLKIDTMCTVFQTMGCIQEDEYKWWGSNPPFFFNGVTGTFPCVIHFNGNAP